MLCSKVEVDDEPIYDVGTGDDEAAEDIYGEIMYRRHQHRRASQPAVPPVVCIMYTYTCSHTLTHTDIIYINMCDTARPVFVLHVI